MLRDYYELEVQRSNLIESTLNISSFTLRVFQYYKYFSAVLAFGDNNTGEAFLKEFLNDYFAALGRFKVYGIDPSFSKKLISQLNELNENEISVEFRPVLNTVITRLNGEFDLLMRMLRGDDGSFINESKAFFPLIDKKNGNEFYGVIESLIVRINRSQTANSFIIIPSEREIEKRISEQCGISWETALSKLKTFIKKPAEFHEVIISFERKEGIYEGNSLGIALTIAFLQELMNFYNPVYSIRILPGAAFTGAITSDGRITFPGDAIIRQKVSAVFYSPLKSFAYPKSAETAAEEQYLSLSEIYPGRKLKLIPVSDVDDILNRRDLVEIRKRNIAKRSGKFLRKNWVSTAVAVISVILFVLLFAADFDDNPYELTADGTLLFVKNMNGKILWRKKIPFDARQVIGKIEISRRAKIVDINSDGENEVVIANEIDEANEFNFKRSLLTCYDKNEKVLWRYSFHDSVYSNRENLNTEYGINILDTLTFAGRRSLFLFSANGPSFSSAIYRIDLKSGKRLPGTFWASGHIMDCFIMNTGSTAEIVGAGYDNGYEDVVFFAYKADTLTSVRPTIPEYIIRGYPLCRMKAYMRFPKTDYDIYMKVRTPTYTTRGLHIDYETKKYKLSSAIPPQNNELETGYEVSFDYKNVGINFSSTFRVRRDTLVSHGLLSLPYTDTKEYRKIVRNNILFLQDGKWINKKED